MGLDFAMTDEQKKVAVPAGIVLLLLLIFGVYFFTKPKSFAAAEEKMAELVATGKAASAEDLKVIAPLLAHPDRAKASQANQYFMTADPQQIVEVAKTLPASSDPKVQSGVGFRAAQVAPQQTVEIQRARLTADRDTRDQAYSIIAATGAPEAVNVLKDGLNDRDETVRSNILSMISSNPNLAKMGKGMAGDLARLANDPKQSQRVQMHAQRALAAVNGNTAGATAPYGPSPLQSGKGK